MKYIDLNHSLELRAAVAYAISLWEQPDVKELVIKACNSVEIEKQISPVTGEIVKKILSVNLPESICLYMVHIVKSMAKNVINWGNFFFQENYLSEILSADAIQWTTIGTIDEVKVFEKLFLNVDMVGKNFITAYQMAYRCVHVDYLLNHNQEIQKFSINPQWFNTSPMISYIQKNYSVNGLKIAHKKVENEISGLFCAAVRHGHLLATKFFWNEMKEENREKYCISLGIECVELYQQKGFFEGFLKDQYVKIMIFIMSKMSADQMNKFFESKKCIISSMVLSVWPEINFFSHLFENFKEILSISEFASILLEIISYFDRRNDLKFNYSECFYFELFKRAYYSFCKSVKKRSIENFSTYFKDVIKKLFQILRVPGLKLIFDSELFKDCKNSSSTIIKGILVGLGPSECAYQLSNMFLTNIFSENNEVQKFKRILWFFHYVIISEKFCTVNQFLVLLDVQRVEFLGENRLELVKSDINLIDLFKILINDNQFDVADNFLNWILKTEEEIEKFKNTISCEEFVKKKMYSIWAKVENKTTFKHNASFFLSFLFKSEIQQDLFKREKLIENRKSVEMFLSENRCFPTVTSVLENLERFITFCEVAVEKITKIKLDIRENLLSFIMSNEDYNFFVIDCLINWCTENDEQRKNTIKDLIKSAGIISLWDKITELCMSVDELVTFCMEWIKGSEDIIKLRDEILTKKTDRYCHVNWKKVFAKLIRGDDTFKNDLYITSPSYNPNSHSDSD